MSYFMEEHFLAVADTRNLRQCLRCCETVVLGSLCLVNGRVGMGRRAPSAAVANRKVRH